MGKWKAGDRAIPGGRPRPQSPKKTHCPKGHKYTEENARWSWAVNDWSARCRECKSIQDHDYRQHNIERLREYDRARYYTNPLRQEWVRLYRQTDKAQQRNRNNVRRYYFANYEQIRKQRKDIYYALSALDYAKMLLISRRRLALKRRVARHARLEEARIKEGITIG